MAETLWGASLSWPLIGSALAGSWLMASPSIFGTRGSAFTIQNIAGALAVVTAFVAWADVTRAVRFFNALVGIALAMSIWSLPEVSMGARLSDTVAGLLLVGLSLPRRPVHGRYGSWDPFIL